MWKIAIALILGDRIFYLAIFIVTHILHSRVFMLSCKLECSRTYSNIYSTSRCYEVQEPHPQPPP
ncbi:hypothetical protein PN476_05565, partial [Dolichospermum circinale CS-537/05]|nr:hypothetical protein [Dolichospermum circinale CS-537/05]